MKRIDLVVWASLALVAIPGFGQSSLAQIRQELAQLKLTRTQAYLAANTNAPDALVAVNMVLEAMQELKQYPAMEPYLLQRYELYRKQPKVQARSIVNATCQSIYSLRMQQKQLLDASTFKKKSLADFPQFKTQLLQAYAVVDKQFAMPKPGQRLPNFVFEDLLTGQAVNLGQAAGNPILLNFWVSKCDICKAQRFFVKQALRDYGPRGLKVYGFSQDEDLQVLRDYIKAEEITWPQAHDLDPRHRIAQKINLVGVPTNFLVDQAGIIVGVNLRDERLLEEIDKLFQPRPAVPAGPPAPPAP